MGRIALHITSFVSAGLWHGGACLSHEHDDTTVDPRSINDSSNTMELGDAPLASA
jgi:hypothetical protein